MQISLSKPVLWGRVKFNVYSLTWYQSHGVVPVLAKFDVC